MRARHPDHDGYVERAGVRTFYEVYGDGAETILLLPPWSIVHSRVWKSQIPYLSRRARVVVFDGRGNGRSDRPAGAAAYRPQEIAVAIAQEIGREMHYAPVESDGAARAAASIAELL